MYGSRMFEGALLMLLCIGIAVGAGIMALLFWVLPWLWTLIKPWLHALTA